MLGRSHRIVRARVPELLCPAVTRGLVRLTNRAWHNDPPDCNAPPVSFDLPEVIADAKSPPPGVELVSGDMFDAETIPQCDAVFMKHILHDWSDENSVKILRSCSSVLNEGGCIYNVECVLPNAGETTDHKAQQVHLDALMMTIGGKERTVKQWHDLAAAAGLRVTEVIPTPIPSAHIVVMKKA